MNSVLNEEEGRLYQHPTEIRRLLTETKTIAMVGLSDKPSRPSHFVATYLQSEGYRIVPVNPRITEVLGEPAYPDLKSIPFPVDMVDIFRKPQECEAIVQDAIEIGAKSIWMQLLIVNRKAAENAVNHGLKVIMDRCVKMEHGRYNGSLHWVGMNTEIISAKKVSRFI